MNKHFKNIFEEEELQKEVVVSKMEITTRHGATKCNGSASRTFFAQAHGEIPPCG